MLIHSFDNHISFTYRYGVLQNSQDHQERQEIHKTLPKRIYRERERENATVSACCIIKLQN